MKKTGQFLIYGATGFTGKLTARVAAERDLKPILAGRNEAKLKAIAQHLGLSYRVFELSDTAALDTALGDVNVVLHIAGPFSATSKPMADACLRTGTHYLDITGEIDVFEALARRDPEAKEGKRITQVSDQQCSLNGSLAVRSRRASAGTYGEQIRSPHKPTLDEMGPFTEHDLPVPTSRAPPRPSTSPTTPQTKNTATAGHGRQGGRGSSAQLQSSRATTDRRPPPSRVALSPCDGVVAPLTECW